MTTTSPRGTTPARSDPPAQPPAGPVVPVALCADVGSTFTKVAAVHRETGAWLGTASHRTTVETDVLHGLDAAIEQLTAVLPGADISTIDVCSSAGGGLRLAVVGYELLVTAEAGRRVALSAGARVVQVSAGQLDHAGLAQVRAARPDVILLVGGTDGGNAEVLLHNAARLATARVGAGNAPARRARVPIVVAGNRDARDEVVATLTARGTPVVATNNVLPRIGQLDPEPARAAIRDVFLRHVIGGKRLSRGPRFASLVRGATPDVVLTAVELLADHLDGDLAVIDIGGATTDVYSVLRECDAPRPTRDETTGDEATKDETTGDGTRSSPTGKGGTDGARGAGGARGTDVAGTLWHSRTVEGDLGTRWSAPGVVEAAKGERLLDVADVARLTKAAHLRADNPGFVPVTDTDLAVDAQLAELAAVIALRRHARGRDLSRVRLLIGSGGVLRHAPAGVGARVLHAVLNDRAGGWALPRSASTVVDVHYVLAAAGLLATGQPTAARALVSRLACEATHDCPEHAERHAGSRHLPRTRG